MNSFLQRHHRLIFYSSWIVLALIQSSFTELLDDEAYYWVYSRFPDWGYFDHPPMTAILIKVGWSIFKNELGVRLFFLLMNVFSLVIIENLVDQKNPFLFYAVALSLAVLQVSGFVAVPDTPLIFFTALFFLGFKKFLERLSALNIFFVGVVTAALLYSKYHAVLIILLVLLSNPRLFSRYQTYFAGLIALLLFAPHLWWQYQHDWISFRYHLFESNVNPYKFSYTLDYIGGQILLAGPLAGIILLPAAFFYRPKNSFERGLKFTLVGIYGFFLLSSFRGKVEANWTSPAIVPLIILSHNFLQQRASWQKWLFRLLPVAMILILLARIVLIIDILPVKEIQKRYHAWREWPHMMREKTNGLPIVFGNSYQRASKYWFYTGQMAYSINWYRERRNNYNFWPIEDSLLGKPVYLLDVHNLDSFQNKMATPIGLVGYRYDSAWSSFARVQFIPAEDEIRARENAPFSLRLTAKLSKFYDNYLARHRDVETEIVAGIFDKRGWVKDIYLPYNLYDLVQKQHDITLNSDLPKGKYYIIISAYAVGTITPTHNSEKITLIIE